MLEKAVILTEQIDQQSIIELQQKVIELKNSDLNSFQTVSVGVQDLLCGGLEGQHNMALSPKRTELFKKNIEAETSSY